MPERPRGRNSYAQPTTKSGSAPNPANEFIWGGPGRYAVPDVPESTDPDYTLGFSPELKAGGSPDGSALPDDIRIGKRRPAATRGTGNYNDPAWERVQNSEKLTRQLDDHQDGMWKIRQDKVPAPNVPIWNQERPATRPTADNSPAGYKFQRYWHIPRQIENALGEGAVTHFSLADHRRNYGIFTQRPQGRLGVNTYRASPRPWDEQLYSPPPAGDPLLGGIAGNRNYRLG